MFVFRHYMQKCGNSRGFTNFVALNSCNDDISSRPIDHYLSRESPGQSVSVRIKSVVL